MTRILEGFWIAINQLQSNKGRAALTVLGVSIGVMVVVVIASMVRGINSGVTDIFEQLGPRTFFVFRHFEGGVVIDDGSDPNSPWRRNPGLTVEEADRIRDLPTIDFVVVRDQSSRPVKYENIDLSSVRTIGFGEGWPEVSGGDIFPGRSFTRLEAAANARVAVVNTQLGERLFGNGDPMGREIKVDGVPFRIIGVWEPPPDIFGDGNDPTVIIPHGAFKKYIRNWGRWLDIMVRPVDSVSVASAIEDVTALMRGIRHLRPADENNFSVVTQDKLLDNWNQVTGMFFLVMIALSSVGLMVGGVGVIAIMMISVTERTREIGVRKALGARRKEILWQFLVEAATLTLIGGMIGMIMGGLISSAVARFSPLPAEVPLWSVVVAIGASILTGVGFGMYPAAKAARLDPVEALRYE